MPSNQELVGWRIDDWSELESIWSTLVGPPDAVQRVTPKFNGWELNEAQAGYVFQTWIVEAFRLSGVEIDPPYDVPRDPDRDHRTIAQIDGLACFDWSSFLIESKFQQVDFGPIARLHAFAEQRPVGTMGLLFAAGGFTVPAIDSTHLLRPIRVLLFSRPDIDHIARSHDMARAIRVKWKQAVRVARANVLLTAT